jgi:hypothetical protein
MNPATIFGRKIEYEWQVLHKEQPPLTLNQDS